jgi:hypothetical protein
MSFLTQKNNSPEVQPMSSMQFRPKSRAPWSPNRMQDWQELDEQVADQRDQETVLDFSEQRAKKSQTRHWIKESVTKNNQEVSEWQSLEELSRSDITLIIQSLKCCQNDPMSQIANQGQDGVMSVHQSQSILDKLEARLAQIENEQQSAKNQFFNQINDERQASWLDQAVQGSR